MAHGSFKRKPHTKMLYAVAYCNRSVSKLLFADVNKTAMKVQSDLNQSDLKLGIITSQSKGLL